MRKVLLLISAVALIAALSNTGKTARKYGMAGCGLGSVIIGPKPGFVQVFAATTNGTFANQIFAITTGTSNCEDDSVAMKDAKQRYYVALNLETLKAEMAKGYGEKLNTYAHLMGCPKGSYARFGKIIQKNYTEIFKDKEDDVSWIHYRVKKVISKDKALKKVCKDIWL